MNRINRETIVKAIENLVVYVEANRACIDPIALENECAAILQEWGNVTGIKVPRCAINAAPLDRIEFVCAMLTRTWMAPIGSPL